MQFNPMIADAIVKARQGSDAIARQPNSFLWCLMQLQWLQHISRRPRCAAPDVHRQLFPRNTVRMSNFVLIAATRSPMDILVMALAMIALIVGLMLLQAAFGSGSHNPPSDRRAPRPSRSRRRIDELALLNPPPCATMDERGRVTGRTCCQQTDDEALTLSPASASRNCDCECHGKPGA